MEETSLHQATKTCGLAFSPIRLQIFANFPSKKITSPLKFGLYKCPQKRSKHIETRFTTKSQNFRFTIYQNSVSPNWIFLATHSPIPSSTSRSSAGARCSTTNSTAFSLTTLERSSRSLKIASTCRRLRDTPSPKKCLDSWTQTFFKLSFQNVSN